MNAQKRMEELIDILNKANYEYYVLANPTIEDMEYDKYLRELIDLENKYPTLARKDSPTKKIGGEVVDKFNKVKHNIPMMSLSNVFNEEEILNFDTKIRKEVNNPKYVCELKIDGLSVSLKYQKGLLITAATRGDGKIGEEITHNVKTIKSVPLKLKKEIDIEVRGEIYMSKKALEDLNKTRKEINEPLFKNARNAAAGSIRQLDSKIAAQRNLDVFIYHLPNPEDYNIKTHIEALEFMKNLGFKTNIDNNFLANDIKEVINYINEKENNRITFPYDIDGVVIKLNNIKDQQKVGYTSKYPKWATAYKFKEQEAITKLKDIIFTVGRTGQVTPNAILEPVFVMGSLISKTTLHNEEYVKEKEIKIGDTVVIKKAGDVIPEVVRVIKERRVGTEQDFHMTKNCPICGSKLAKKEEESAYYCINASCDARKIEGLIHYASRDAMNLTGFGDRIVEDFYNMGYLKNISDYYSLKNYKDELKVLEGFGEKSISNLLNEVENSKQKSLEKLLFALGIRYVGSKTAHILAKFYHNIDNLMNAHYEELEKIDDIGKTISKSVYNYFQNEENIVLINKLKSFGINMEYLGELEIDNNFLNKTFVLTGSLNSITRDKATQIIEKKGGKTSNSVSKNTDIVIVGENAGSKLAKAQELNIQTWTEEEFLSHIGSSNEE